MGILSPPYPLSVSLMLSLPLSLYSMSPLQPLPLCTLNIMRAAELGKSALDPITENATNQRQASQMIPTQLPLPLSVLLSLIFPHTLLLLLFIDHWLCEYEGAFLWAERAPPVTETCDITHGTAAIVLPNTTFTGHYSREQANMNEGILLNHLNIKITNWIGKYEWTYLLVFPFLSPCLTLTMHDFPPFTLCDHMYLTYIVLLTQVMGEGTQTPYIKYRVKNWHTVTPETAPFWDS